MKDVCNNSKSLLYRGTELKGGHQGRAITKMVVHLPPGPLWLFPILVEDTFQGGETKRYLLEPGYNHAFLSKRLALWIDLIQKFGHDNKIGDKVTEFWINEEQLKSVQRAKLLLDAILPPPPPQLNFDIGVLLNKDLMNNQSNNNETPAWYNSNNMSWFVRDDMSRENEAAQHHPYLYTKRAPAVGQRVLIQFNLPNGSWGLLFGVLTNVGAPVSEESDLAAMGSNFYGKSDDGSFCFEKHQGEAIRSLLGAVHGEKVTAVVSLDADFHQMKHLTEFFRGNDTLYKVDLRFNDHKQHMWEVARLEPVI